MLGLLVSLVAAVMPVYEMAPPDVDAYLSGLQGGNLSFAQRVAEVAERTLGAPYFNGPLGEGPSGKYDKDPLMDLTRVDCVTFVEQTLALANASSYLEAHTLLQRIRYEGGRIGFATRNHFMAAEWAERNTFCRDVSQALGVAAGSVTRTISKDGFFDRVDAPALKGVTPDREVTVHYVPVASVKEAEAKLPSPAVIVFVGKVDWLFALHCGLYIRDAEGVGKLYHASSKEEKVVAVPLADYLADTTRYLGFAAYGVEGMEK